MYSFLIILGILIFALVVEYLIKPIISKRMGVDMKCKNQIGRHWRGIEKT